MPKATDNHTPTTPDAELTRLHAALIEQTAVLARMEADKLPPGITPESDAHEQRMLAAERHYRAIAAEVTRTPAHGEAGLKAKAAALMLALEHYLCHRIGSGLDDIATGEMGDDDHRLSLSLARDIVGREPGSQDISPDAYLITLCDRIVAMNAEEKAIDARHDDPDNDPIDGPRLEANAVEYKEIVARIEELIILTSDGANAVARAALPEARKQPNGEFAPTDLHEELSMMLIEYHARGAVQ
jgi:hypothetical protein